MKQRYLTKSRFVTATKCPRKLYYANRPDVYENKNLDNQFLRALADGGFQVGALAKVYHPGGHEVVALNHQQALAETAELLEQDKVVIYEAAFAHENLFVRVDILLKNGNSVELIEVKAKSFNPSEDEFFDKRLLKKGVRKTTEKWKKYLYDVAYQTMVCELARPDFKFKPFMMFADKTATASVDGLNQKFLLLEEKGRPVVKTSHDATLNSVGDEILCKIDVRDVVDAIIRGRDLGDKSREQLGLPSFEAMAKEWAQKYVRDERLAPKHGSQCKSCEFRTNVENGAKSGFAECWTEKIGNATVHPLVFDVWNFRKSDSLIEDGKFLMSELDETDIEPKSDKNPGMSASERQWLQVKLFKGGVKSAHVEKEELANEMAKWSFPLHFIDFETTTVAIPFNTGRRPYGASFFLVEIAT